jgi:peptidoglycan-associated lipoprotein
MKHAKFFNLFAAALILSLGVVGCKHKPKAPTPIVGRTGQVGDGSKPFPGEVGNAAKLDDATAARPIDTKDGGIGQNVRPPLDEMNQDHDRFAANTVYFDFDRATIKPSETSKIDDVVKYLQGNPTHAMQIEGHCDERGTEQYNLSLGERRALAVREYLVTAGIQPDRVFTISYGEARPAETGHNEAAWSKNRRGAFVLLTPK